VRRHEMERSGGNLLYCLIGRLGDAANVSISSNAALPGFGPTLRLDLDKPEAEAIGHLHIVPPALILTPLPVVLQPSENLSPAASDAGHGAHTVERLG